LFLRPRRCHGDCPLFSLSSVASISTHDGARQRCRKPCKFREPCQGEEELAVACTFHLLISFAVRQDLGILATTVK
jgi:hypothetical protein